MVAIQDLSTGDTFKKKLGAKKTYAPAPGKNISTKDLLTTVGKKTKFH